MSEEFLSSGKIRVCIVPSLLVLVPKYLNRRVEDVGCLQNALVSGDFETIRVIGHKLSGHAGTYGFDRLSEIGIEIEVAAKAGDVKTIQRLVQLFTDYLENIEIVQPERLLG